MSTEVAVKTEDAPNFQVAIIQAAKDPNTDVSKMQAMWSMYQEMEKHKAEKAFNAAMDRVQAELLKRPVVKNKENRQTNSMYADLEAIYRVAKPILNENGLRDSYEDDSPRDKWVGTTCVITHVDGHQSRNRVEFPFDEAGIKGTVNKTGPHAAASSMTYGQRISFCRALGIQIVRDDDGNMAGSHLITPEQVKEINDLLLDTNTDIKKFCDEYIKLPSVADMTAAEFPKVQQALRSKKRKMEGEK